ncbi:DUF2505 domain-containing protein [uncultured Zhongshania sp.]|uniref:DUF2505 domain-containing protein n=1 Tax=uncultured Zhongshania sp. TaxID=1642288 RepID=UPI0025D0DF6F|nr:DUF2505 domain-containing protein [uncultured Zhongshania sp.]
MKFVEEHIFDAPLEAVERMYFNTTFCPRKYEELGLEDIKIVDSSDDPVQYFVDCSFVMEPSLPLPGFVKKFLPGGQKISVRQVDRWNTKTGKGELDIQLHGLEKVHIHSVMTLKAHERGAINIMQWTVECKIPLIGNKLADFLGKDIRSKSADDHAASVKILQEYL